MFKYFLWDNRVNTVKKANRNWQVIIEARIQEGTEECC
jgi:hypothetical protein